MLDRNVKRCDPILCLQIDVTSRGNELLRDVQMPFYGRDVDRRGALQDPTLHLEIEFTVCCNELIHHGSMPCSDGDVERREISRSTLHRAIVSRSTLRILHTIDCYSKTK
jgi:hypothetical protein